MPTTVLVVDGYNAILGALGMGAACGSVLASFRASLVRICCELASRRKDSLRIIVVFDGEMASVPVPPSCSDRVFVVFAGAGQSADDRIVACARRYLADNARTTVFSDDRELCRRASAEGAETRSIPDLFAVLSPRKKAIPDEREEPAKDQIITPESQQAIDSELRRIWNAG